MVNWVKLDRQRRVDKSIMMYKIVNRMVPDYLSSLFVFRIIVKEARHTADPYCGMAYPWILFSQSLLMYLIYVEKL